MTEQDFNNMFSKSDSKAEMEASLAKAIRDPESLLSRCLSTICAPNSTPEERLGAFIILFSGGTDRVLEVTLKANMNIRLTKEEKFVDMLAVISGGILWALKDYKTSTEQPWEPNETRLF